MSWNLQRDIPVEVMNEAGGFWMTCSISVLAMNDSSTVLLAEETAGKKYALKASQIEFEDKENHSRRDPIRATFRMGAVWKELQHDHILPFLGTSVIRAQFYLVSPYYANGGIDKFASKHPGADEITLVRLMHEAAYALEYLHSKGVIHGNIKGANILVSDDIHALLGGFDLTTTPESSKDDVHQLSSVGTMQYMSPDLWREDGPKTTKSDVWAFGMTLAQVINKTEVPFPAFISHPMALYLALEERRLPEISPSAGDSRYIALAWQVAERCWSADAAERPSMAEVRELLSKAELGME